MAAKTILTDKMRAAIRTSSKNKDITEEIEDCIAACKKDLQDVGVKRLDETDPLIIRAITLYVKAEFGFNENAEKFHNSYESLKTHLSMSSEYNTVSETDTGAEGEEGGQDNGSVDI